MPKANGERLQLETASNVIHDLESAHKLRTGYRMMTGGWTVATEKVNAVALAKISLLFTLCER